MSLDVARIQEWLGSHEDELLEDYRSMLRVPSVESEGEPGAPFGKANREALNLALQLGQKYGFRTKDLDGFAGYAEFGEGPLVLSLGHLDVVPTGPGWKHDPFGAEVEDGYVYARGAVDDKGPTMASFYAIRAIKESVPNLGARLRQVFGCNEESGFRCIDHYVKVEESPIYGVAPDSMWPLVHAEKGIATLVIKVPLNQGRLRLVELSGGQRPNIVIDCCEALLEVASDLRPGIEQKLADAWDKNLSWSWNGSMLMVRSAGKAAHGSTPFYGDSAATRLFRFLVSLAPFDEVRYFEDLFYSTHPSGPGLGIHGNDEVSKDLTSNLGMVSTMNGNLHLTVNVRYPVSWDGEELRSRCVEFLKTREGASWTLESFRDSPSMNFPVDHPLVRTIVNAYEEETGERKAPGVMGGGTYARAIANTVSIGTCWDGDGKAHETDERFKIEHLHKAARIYAHILYDLAQLAQKGS